MEQPGAEEILTPAEVAALFKIHVNTVYRLVNDGVIPGIKIGRGWRFSKRDLLKISYHDKRTGVQTRKATQA